MTFQKESNNCPAKFLTVVAVAVAGITNILCLCADLQQRFTVEAVAIIIKLGARERKRSDVECVVSSAMGSDGVKTSFFIGFCLFVCVVGIYMHCKNGVRLKMNSVRYFCVEKKKQGGIWKCLAKKNHLYCTLKKSFPQNFKCKQFDYFL